MLTYQFTTIMKPLPPLRICAILLLPFVLAHCGPDIPEPVACMEMDGGKFRVYDPIQFTSCSENPERHTWHFGNGDESYEDHPRYTYTEPGTYNVVMIVSNVSGSDTLLRKVAISENNGISANQFTLHLALGDSQTFNCAPAFPIQFRIYDNYLKEPFLREWLMSNRNDQDFYLQHGEWEVSINSKLGHLQYFRPSNTPPSPRCNNCYEFNWIVPDCENLPGYFTIYFDVRFRGLPIEGSPKSITGFLPG